MAKPLVTDEINGEIMKNVKEKDMFVHMIFVLHDSKEWHLVSSRQMKDCKYIGPSRLDIVSLAMHHVGHTSDHHVSDTARLVTLHDMFKRSEEIFLKVEVGKFSFFNEFCGQLAQRINSKERNILRRVTSNCIDVIT